MQEDPGPEPSSNPEPDRAGVRGGVRMALLVAGALLVLVAAGLGLVLLSSEPPGEGGRSAAAGPGSPAAPPAPLYPSVAAASPTTPVAGATRTIVAHNRAGWPVELWAGGDFLGRIEPGTVARIDAGAIEHPPAAGLAITAVSHEKRSEAEGDDAPGQPDAWVLRSIVLPDALASVGELTVVVGGIEPIDAATPVALDDPGEPRWRGLFALRERHLAGQRPGAPLPAEALMHGRYWGGLEGSGWEGGEGLPAGRIEGGVMAVHGPRDDARGRDRYVVNSLGMLLVRIPAGRFQPGEFQAGSPRPTVTLTRAYYMSVTEATNTHVARVEHAGHRTGSLKGFSDLPALRILWDQADAWCRSLTAMEAARGQALDGWAYDLPTEAQWERACQAGRLQPFSPAGQPADKIMWWFENSGQQPQPVAQLLPNDFGLFDMHGNAIEWGRDWAYMLQPVSGVDPTGVTRERAIRGWGSNEPERVRRGGAFDSRDHRCSCGKRDSGPPGLAMHFQGFRPVLVRE
ncbi:MAG: formylglycine-generating enzyme family protein [Phycisphaerales bacterium JB060]